MSVRLGTWSRSWSKAKGGIGPLFFRQEPGQTHQRLAFQRFICLHYPTWFATNFGRSIPEFHRHWPGFSQLDELSFQKRTFYWFPAQPPVRSLSSLLEHQGVGAGNPSSKGLMGQKQANCPGRPLAIPVLRACLSLLKPNACEQGQAKRAYLRQCSKRLLLAWQVKEGWHIQSIQRS